MTILNININDFGGINHHMEEFKNKYGKRWYISRWDAWNQQTDCIWAVEEKWIPLDPDWKQIPYFKEKFWRMARSEIRNYIIYLLNDMQREYQRMQ